MICSIQAYSLGHQPRRDHGRKERHRQAQRVDGRWYDECADVVRIQECTQQKNDATSIA